MLHTVYQAQLLDHYRNPRNKGLLSRADFATDEFNPSCGDRVAISGTIIRGKIKKLAFDGTGCVISQATASLLTDHCTGKSVEQVMLLNADSVQRLIGVALGPVRLKCALLPLEALHNGISLYKSQ